ncbi:hypothetical protein KFK09_015190 [Dendrobium nobile]|uniref:Uncharacterized protein n=1 Tax=Dendrobium nobile TaxID=94219 RepID=A0A8T3B443_DENNO|nr:hypothetical protein KFK09_015190 [Dendrobium nobile]
MVKGSSNQIAVRLRSSKAFPSCWIGSYDILIGSNEGSSPGVKVTFSLSRVSSTKSRKSAESEDFGNPGFTTKRGNFPSTAAFIYTGNRRGGISGDGRYRDMLVRDGGCGDGVGYDARCQLSWACCCNGGNWVMTIKVDVGMTINVNIGTSITFDARMPEMKLCGR